MNETQPWQDDSSGARHFATTSWSMVVAAGDVQSEQSRTALENLCELYWYPLYAFVRRKGHNRNDAEDLTQGFFTHLLDRDRLQLADQERGRFRTFLITALNNFIIQDWRKQTAEKRGGQRQRVSLDFEDADRRYSLEPTVEMTPEKWFDRRWAIQILDDVVQDLGEYYHQREKDQLFAALKPFLIQEGTQSYAELAQELGMNEIAVKVAAHRMRGRYRDLLRQRIQQTVESETEVEAELAALFAALA
ncbi:MAG: RNA polymerase sigma factor [Pirellulaceae bacterium]